MNAAAAAAAAPAGDGMLRRVAGNSLWLIGQPLLLNVISILSTGYIARKLGVTAFGVFTLGYAQIGLFIPLCSLGMRAVAVRAIAQDRARAQEVLNTILSLRLLFTAAAALLALVWLSLPIYPVATRLVGLAAVLSMVFSALGTVPVDLFQGFERSRLGAQPQLISGLVLTALSVLALAVGLGLAGFVAAYVIGAAVQCALLFYAVHRERFALRLCWDRGRARELLRQTRPFALMSAVGGITEVGVLDVMLLGVVAGAAGVGPYTAAQGLVTRLLMIPSGIGDALFPAVAGGEAGDPAATAAAVRRAVQGMLLLTLPLSLCLCLTAPTVLWLVFGPEYASGALPLRIAAWLLPLIGFGYIARECLAAVHRQDIVVRLVLVSGALLVGAGGVLVPALGAPGAALALVLKETVMAALWLPPFSARFERPLPLRELASTLPALGLMAAPLVLSAAAHNHLLVIASVPVAFVLYAAVVWRQLPLPGPRA